jgi:cytochrome P450
MNPERQERLRREVQAARRDGGDLYYSDVLALPYLEAVCKETLRMYVLPLTTGSLN